MRKLILLLCMVSLLAGPAQVNAACPISDLNGDCKVDMDDLIILMSEWLSSGVALPTLNGMTWVSISDPGVAGHEAFIGEMSAYETTNAQYCLFLNAALASGDITVGPDNIVYGANGSNSGADFAGEIYFNTYAASSYSRITYSGGTFSVRTCEDIDYNDIDMSDHPVVEVSWYGAAAFCNYYGVKLPTEWQWQAVADHTTDDPYTYGCGNLIDFSRANYYDSGYANPLKLSDYPYTGPVGYYILAGYGIYDMAGNVWEWTSSLYSPAFSYRMIRGGGWDDFSSYCQVSNSDSFYPHETEDYIGFRVCR